MWRTDLEPRHAVREPQQPQQPQRAEEPQQRVRTAAAADAAAAAARNVEARVDQRRGRAERRKHILLVRPERRVAEPDDLDDDLGDVERREADLRRGPHQPETKRRTVLVPFFK